MTPPEMNPYGRAYSQLCSTAFLEVGSCPGLVFQVSSPTPITIAASGTAVTSGYGGADSSYALYRCSSSSSCRFTAFEDVITDFVDVTTPDVSKSFDRRFSTTLSPGFYGFGAGGFAVVNEANSISNNVTASLDIVLTLSPVGDCSDGLDNDGDTLVDLDDSDCADGTDTSEAAPLPPGVPALGAAGRAVVLTTLLLLTLHHLRARRQG
jgi:hypothetical protein